MKTSIALVSAALLFGAAWRRAEIDLPAASATPADLALASGPSAAPQSLRLAPVESGVASPPASPASRRAQLTETALRAFNQGSYTFAESLCWKLLLDSPVDPAARGLLDRLPEARRGQLLDLQHRRRTLPVVVDALNDLTEDEWNELTPVLLEAGRQELDNEWQTTPPQRILESTKIAFAFEQTAFEDVLAFIRDFSGLNLILETELRSTYRPSVPVTVRVKDATVRQALRVVLDQVDRALRILVTEENVVLVTR